MLVKVLIGVFDLPPTMIAVRWPYVGGGEPARGLGSAGLSVEWSRAGGPTLQGAVGETADVIVLDLGLPDVGGPSRRE